jgi:hypothetical protein
VVTCHGVRVHAARLREGLQGSAHVSDITVSRVVREAAVLLQRLPRGPDSVTVKSSQVNKPLFQIMEKSFCYRLINIMY